MARLASSGDTGPRAYSSYSSSYSRPDPDTDRKDIPIQPRSIRDIFEMAKMEAIGAVEFYHTLPKELQRMLDSLSGSLKSVSFVDADRSTRLQVLEMTLKIFDEHIAREKIISRRKKDKQCIMCGKRLGFFNKLLGRKQHRACTQWKE